MRGTIGLAMTAHDVPDPRTEAQPHARHNARWYLSGLAASLVGDSAMTLVAGIWVKSLTGSSAQAGLVSACVYAPTLLAPVAGLLADRVPRRAWLIAVNLVAAATLPALLAVRSRADAWLIDAVMAAYGVELVLTDPVEDALFAELFTTDFRRRLNGVRLAIQETGRLVAPLLGAGLFVLVGGGPVAALDAGTFVLAAIAVSRLRVPRPPTAGAPGASEAAGASGATGAASPPEPLGTALAAGVRHILATPAIRPVALAVTAVMAISGLGVAAQYSLVSAIDQRPAFLGVLSAVLGAGSVAAALTSGRLIARLGERRVALIGIADLAAGDLLRCVPSTSVVVGGTLVLGFALPYAFLGVLSVAQRETPTHLQGRVSAALSLALFGPQAPMQALGALLIAHVTYAEVYAGSAALTLVAGGWLAGTASRAST